MGIESVRCDFIKYKLQKNIYIPLEIYQVDYLNSFRHWSSSNKCVVKVKLFVKCKQVFQVFATLRCFSVCRKLKGSLWLRFFQTISPRRLFLSVLLRGYLWTVLYPICETNLRGERTGSTRLPEHLATRLEMLPVRHAVPYTKLTPDFECIYTQLLKQIFNLDFVPIFTFFKNKSQVEDTKE